MSDSNSTDKTLCCVDGCGREAPYTGKALCQKHYFRQWRNNTTDLTRSRKPRIENPDGYQFLWMPDHPLSQKTGYVAEHRFVLYAEIGDGQMSCEICGKALTWGTCHADHIDTNVKNNELSNLRPLCSRCNTHRDMPPPVEWNRTHVIEFGGLKMTPAEWARDTRVNICGRQIVLRKKAGMSDEDALFSKKRTHTGVKARELRKAQE